MADLDDEPAQARQGDAAGNPNHVGELTPGCTGRWLVTTRGSKHEFDLDAGTYRRTPGSARAAFPYDGVTVVVTRVEVWPHVGRTFLIWFDDVDCPAFVERWHRSSTITAITRIGD